MVPQLSPTRSQHRRQRLVIKTAASNAESHTAATAEVGAAVIWPSICSMKSREVALRIMRRSMRLQARMTVEWAPFEMRPDNGEGFVVSQRQKTGAPLCPPVTGTPGMLSPNVGRPTFGEKFLIY
jgi:hypothetical protein